MRKTRQRRRPSLEVLEDRSLLAIYGIPWPDPQHLTVSFVPDGTSVGGSPSTLFGTLNAQMPTTQWESDVLSGLQAWADSGNINIAVVPDDGRPLGAPGPLQGVPGVGDIRIAARPLSHNEVAIGSPYDALGGWAGTVVFNSDASFGDGPSAAENFFTAAVHEAGHVFGFADQHSDPSSIMYNVDTGPRTGPSAADIAALQSLYGARKPDAYGTSPGNGTFATALPVAFNTPPSWAGDSGDHDGPSVVDADITTLNDKDMYSFTTPNFWFGQVSVTVRTAGVSLLTPKVTVYDAFGTPVGSAVSTDPLNNNVTVNLPDSLPGMTYYAQVQSGQSNVFGIGGYRLAVGSTDQALAATMTPEALTFASKDGHTNDSFDTATPLMPATPGTDARWPYAITAGLSWASDLDFYKIQTGSTTPSTALVTVYGLSSGGLAPAVFIFDALHNPLPVHVLSFGQGGETVQIQGISSNSSLYVEVAAAGSSGSSLAGDYFLGLTYRAMAVASPTLASGTLTASSRVAFRTLTVDATRLFHFDLSGTTTAGSLSAAVLVTIFDSNDKPVFTEKAVAGAEATQGDVMLNPGTYIVRIVAATKTGVALPDFTYTFNGQLRDEPEGPSPVDTTFDPIGPNPTGPPNDSGSWTQRGSAYYMNVLNPADIYGDPWS